ncbi:MAG: PipX family protein [Cyanobacteria bacterium P01_F01_bin.153]
MSLENYFNHPTFGLLLLICPLGNGQDLYTTLYAQRLFFLVKEGNNGMGVEPLSRGEARSLVENQMRVLRRSGKMKDYKEIQDVFRRTFQ